MTRDRGEVMQSQNVIGNYALFGKASSFKFEYEKRC